MYMCMYVYMYIWGGTLGGPWGTLGGPWGDPGGTLGAPWGDPGGTPGSLGGPWGGNPGGKFDAFVLLLIFLSIKINKIEQKSNRVYRVIDENAHFRR